MSEKGAVESILKTHGEDFPLWLVVSPLDFSRASLTMEAAPLSPGDLETYCRGKGIGMDVGRIPTVPIKINSKGHESEALRKELHSCLRNVRKSHHVQEPWR